MNGAKKQLILSSMQLRFYNIIDTLFLLCFLTISTVVFAQNNVGIGTTSPHPSAILDIDDNDRGVLIPQTDTTAVLNYVNSLTPPSPIANGLIIYEVNLKTYVYYDGVLKRWRKLIDLVGPTGPTGLRGSVGPIGPTGHTTLWRDSVNSPPTLRPDDNCGSYYFHNQTGVLWRVVCNPDGSNRRWADTASVDNEFGVFRAPNETILAATFRSNLNQNESMASGGPNITDDVVLVNISGLNMTFDIQRDEIAYVWVFSHGTVSNSFGKNNYSYAQYDIQLSTAAQIDEGHNNKFFFDRDQASNGQMGNIFTIGKNGPPPPFETFGLFDQVGWSASASYTIQGPLTYPPPCDEFCGSVPCPTCPLAAQSVEIRTVGGNRFSTGNVDMKIADGTGKLNQAFMSVYVVIRRSPIAIARKR
jgi:hypothetical protein